MNHKFFALILGLVSILYTPGDTPSSQALADIPPVDGDGGGVGCHDTTSSVCDSGSGDSACDSACTGDGL